MASKYIILTLAIATLSLLIHSSVLVTGQDLRFNETFNVETEESIYVQLIEKLRTRVRDQNHAFVGGVPMLPSVQECSNNHFHIILIHGSCHITVQIQQVNLYLVAFQGKNGSWYAFRDEVKRAPPNSEPLSFPARYSSDVASIKVGRASLQNAICGLAKYHKNENKKIQPSKKENEDIRRLLITLMVMFPEAIRFKRVAEFVNPCMLKFCTTDPEIGTNITHLIKNWEAISKEMRRYNQSGNFKGFPNLNITTVEQAVSTVGILLYQEIPKGTDKKNHTFDQCMVVDRREYFSTNTCPAAQD